MELQTRAGYRSQITKIVNEATEYLKSPECNDMGDLQKLDATEEDLSSLWHRLKTANENLRSLNKEVQSKNLEDKNPEKVAEYEDVASGMIARLEVRLSKVRGRLGLLTTNNGDPQSSSGTLSQSHYVKLPKLQLKKFSGDFKEWIPFWENFRSAVHENKLLSGAEKFNYLQSVLTGNAAKTIAGFTPSAACYDGAISLLQEEYGDGEKLIDRIMQQLMALPSVHHKADAAGLRNLYSTVISCSRSLTALGIPSTHYYIMLKTILLKCMPNDLRICYHRLEKESASSKEDGDESASESNSTLSFDGDRQVKNILRFLKREVESIERSAIDKVPKQNERLQVTHTTAAGLLTPTTISTITSCFFCKSTQHLTRECNNSQTLEQKKQALKNDGRCYRCTQKGHTARFCRMKRIVCKRCKLRHPTVLCDSNINCKSVTTDETKTTNKFLGNEPQSSKVLSLCLPHENERKGMNIYLQTARVFVLDTLRREKLFVRIIIDGGSQRSYVREAIAKRLKLPVVNFVHLNVIPFGKSDLSNCKKFPVVKLIMQSQHCDRSIELSLIVVPEICLDVLAAPDPDSFKLGELALADSNVNCLEQEEGLSILLGADYYWTVVSGEYKRITNRLTAMETTFGWTILGPSVVSNENTSNCENVSSLCSFVAVENMWNLELLGIQSDISESEALTKDMQAKYIRKTGSRYEASLPWKNPEDMLGDNREIALVRLNSLVKRLSREPSKLFEYDKALREFITSGFAELIGKPIAKRGYYLPHRPVYRPEKSTTKIRIVFDASSHAEGTPSLNECLWTGSNLLPDILKIILRFRMGKIALVADVEKAFLQIVLAEEDRDSHRFIWFSDELHSLTELPALQEFRMTRVTFGVTSSPFLLSATILLHLDLEAINFPKTCRLLRDNFYMDDLVISLGSKKYAESFQKEAVEVMGRASMNLRQWISNDADLRKSFGAEDSDSIRTVLGLKWNVFSDELMINAQPEKVSIDLSATKRNVLKVIARIYDPLGFLSPVVIRLKIFFQALWRMKLDWDEPMTGNLIKEWNSCVENLEELETISLPRWVYFCEHSTTREVHIFADASPKAFGAVAFVRTVSPAYGVKISFLCAKARVAPLKETEDDNISLPKLELTAALIAARLSVYFRKAGLPFDNHYLWTDSQIALHWLRGDARKWKPYIFNRVKEIQQLTSAENWGHCNSKDNPADLITRGITLKQFKTSALWNNGPKWLNNRQEDWPVEFEPRNISTILLTASSQMTTSPNTITEPLMAFERISNWRRLLRITAYVIRAVNKLVHKKEPGSRFLVAMELEEAKLYWIRYFQRLYFAEELLSLQQERPISRSSTLLTLNPILDEEGIIRVGSRLQFMPEPVDIVNPVILPRSSYLSQLIVIDLHERLLHAGVTTVLARLREKFWLPKGRQLIKKIISQCRFCRRMKGKPGSTPFASLPKERLSASRPFENVGVDFAGPLFTSGDNGQHKVYVMIFTCAVIRAIHLELVPNLSTKSCLLAIRRFISRRGVPNTIFSDNAKTFKKSATELKNLDKILNDEVFNGFLANHGITWRFILERAPWWGGFWERLIKSVKDILKVTIWKAKINDDELHTLLTEAERIINMRPLTYLSDDPLDLSPLTPECFLLDQLSATSDKTISDYKITKDDLRARWKTRMQYTSFLWKRWKIEYLRLLRSAHHSPHIFSREIKLGDVVLVYDFATPRIHWRLAIVENCFPGRDNKVRACEVRFADGKRMRRPVQLLYPLEIRQSVGPEDVKN